jgi:hypothetical protein
LLTYNIFSYINPKLVVVTTPNRDFNVYFPDPKQFRHDDHKFEWTREEFTDWCRNTADMFGYSFKLTGVGLPEGFTDKGFCTQIAVFTRLVMKNEREDVANTFKTIRKSLVPKNYPQNFELKFYNDFLYSFNVARKWAELDYDEGILISDIFRVPSMSGLCDGSPLRLHILMEEILPKFSLNYRLEGGKVFIDSEEPTEEED